MNQFKQVGSISLLLGEIHSQSAVIDLQRGYAYFGAGGSPGSVIQIRLSDFTRTMSLSFGVGENFPLSAITDGNYAYFATWSAPTKIIKIDLSNFTRVADLTIPLLNFPGFPFIALVQNGVGYFCSDVFPSPPATIVAVRLSDLTVLGSVTMPAGGPIHSALCHGSEYAFFGASASSPMTDPIIFKVDLATLTVEDQMIIPTSGSFPDIPASAIDLRGVTCDNKFLYFAVTTNSPPTPDTIIKIDVDSFTIVKTLQLYPGQSIMVTGFADTASDYAYFGAFNPAPGIIVKVSMSDLVYRGQLLLNTGENNVLWAPVLLDNRCGAFAYFTTNSGQIVKIDISQIPQAQPSSQYIFQVDLSNKTSVPSDQDNVNFTKSLWLPDFITDNYEYLHGRIFTAYGQKAIYLRDNYTKGPDAVLKLLEVVNTPSCP